MTADLKKEIALRDELIEALEKAGKLRDKCIDDLQESLKAQDKLIETLTTESESKDRTIELQNKHIHILDEQNEKHKQLIKEMLSYPSGMED